MRKVPDWFVPAKFIAICQSNDQRVISSEDTTVRNSSEGRGQNVGFVANRNSSSRSEFIYNNALSVVATGTIAPGQELYVATALTMGLSSL